MRCGRRRFASILESNEKDAGHPASFSFALQSVAPEKETLCAQLRSATEIANQTLRGLRAFLPSPNESGASYASLQLSALAAW